ncbi:fimbrial protein [Gallibacterium sp. AGMB14963]|uniref:fimbrial protein n=1 Tax=Gallibacterium faecale TaxID=3019086 RepID=UPI0022F1A488|nr:fimbrial protein [Gallibacterium sp. AGMB14963]MDA3978881.1 fimbrial protein [Gallibacterium sp. AGMB14963]
MRRNNIFLGIVCLFISGQGLAAIPNTIEVEGNRTGSTITYTGTISKNVKADLCNNRDSDYGYWIEIKYDNNKQDESVFQENYFVDSINVSSGAGGTKIIQGNWSTNQTIKVAETDDELSIQVQFDRKIATITKATPSIDGKPILDMTFVCWRKTGENSSALGSGGGVANGDLGEINNNLSKDVAPIGWRVKLVSKNNLTFSNTCRLLSAPTRTINLHQARTIDLNQGKEVSGGTFDVALDCNQSDVSDAYISFTDANNSTNNTQILTLDNTSTATNVGLKVYEEGDTSSAIRYGIATSPFASISDNNVRRFATSIQGLPTVKKSYKVYYVKTPQSSSSTAGSVNAKLIYNLYYQ